MAKRAAQPIELHRALETMLFLAGRPLTVKKIASLLGCDQRTAQSALDAFRTTWNARGGGTIVATAGEDVQLVSHADLRSIAETMAKDEVRSELTRPQLEALTTIAYRGPITKAELEQIRGVACGLILRNLLIRGLISERRDPERHEDIYEVSMDFLRHIGVSDVRELPEYDALHGSTVITEYLRASAGAPGPAVSAPSV